MSPETLAQSRRFIDQRIKNLDDWRGETLARVRGLILAAVPGVQEEWKWSLPVWSLEGIICTGETYKQTVKLTFAHGAKLKDPAGLFNSSLTGNTRRAIDIREGERLNARAFKALVKEAVAFNRSKSKAPKPRSKTPTKSSAKTPANTPAKTATKTPAKSPNKKVVLLSGGNPQIPRGEGNAPVQAYIAAIPGWRRESAARVDALVERCVPGVQKAIKWNSAFYGREPSRWFLTFHVFERYLKLGFFRGSSLKPMPPEPSKSKEMRYLHLTEGVLDEKQLSDWLKQAAALPGEKM